MMRSILISETADISDGRRSGKKKNEESERKSGKKMREDTAFSSRFSVNGEPLGFRRARCSRAGAGEGGNP